jgi:hypothetical protein
MSRARLATLGILFGVAGIALLHAEDFSSYRGFQFGMSLSAAAKQAGTKPSEAKSVHQRPALIQELEWQPRSSAPTDPQKAEAVKDGLLYFLNDQLYRVVVTYDRYRIEGMTAEDMIAAISTTYGPATRPTAEVAYHSYYGDSAAVIARWEDAEYSYNLVKTGDHSSYALVLYSKRLDVLAQTAVVEAARLDAQEAPQREIDKQKKQEEDEQIVLDKARSANKPNFRP